MKRPQSYEEGEAVPSQHENPNRTSKLPSERVVLLVLGFLLAVALLIIYRLSIAVLMTNQTIQSLKKEDGALRKNLSDQRSLMCEAGWELHGGKCYKFNTRKSSWTESRLICKYLGGDLVKIGSREEQMFLEIRLRDMMVEEEDMFWIGLTDSKEEGRWLWVDGSPLDKSWTFWAHEQPDDLGKNGLPGADCARMVMEGEAKDLKCWHDRGCDYHQKSICAKAAGTVKGSCVGIP